MIKYSLSVLIVQLNLKVGLDPQKFDRLKKLKLLNCQNCNSLKIEKSLMSPNLANTRKK